MVTSESCCASGFDGAYVSASYLLWLKCAANRTGFLAAGSLSLVSQQGSLPRDHYITWWELLSSVQFALVWALSWASECSYIRLRTLQRCFLLGCIALLLSSCAPHTSSRLVTFLQLSWPRDRWTSSLQSLLSLLQASISNEVRARW